MAQTSLAHRKQYGQFFTPPPVADLLARWVAGAQPVRVLDPAIGTGVLARALQTYVPTCQITGYDVDPHILRWLRVEAGQPDTLECVCEDFLRTAPTARYDGIIANPPYLKFHDYDNLATISRFEQETGVKLTGFTNLYALFLLKALRLLSPGGRAAFVVPSEFLNADYGVAVKQQLQQNGSLRHVLVVDFQGSVFADALTTACVLLFARDEMPTPAVTFSYLESVEALADWTPDLAPAPRPLQALDATSKWRRYYQPGGDDDAVYGPLVPFSTVGKVSRGIATGDNGYFIFSASKARTWGLAPGTSLSPCITRSADVPGAFFTDADFAALRRADRPVYLLDVRAAADQAAQRYLAEGERQGVAQKFLPAHRTPWHRPEKRPPAPIWVTVFNRGGLRFVRNETATLNLTTFHCVYLNLFFQDRADLVMAYLLTEVAREIFAQNRREYGNGLEKFEPNDLNKAPMLDLSHLTAAQVAHFEDVYQRYRQSVLAGSPAEELRAVLDTDFRAAFALSE